VPDSVHLIESRPQTLRLAPVQVSELTRLSSALAGQSDWWGAKDGAESRETRVISVEPRQADHYAVTIWNAVGAIGLPGLGISIGPKIPLPHFAHIASRALNGVARMDAAPIGLAAGVDFFEIIARWLVMASEALVRQGLARDYREVEEFSSVIRGSIDVRATTMNWLRGEISAALTVEEFDFDAPMNRVVKAALQSISNSSWISDDTRSGARRIVRAMPGVSAFRAADLAARPHRGQARYQIPLALARQVLQSLARSLDGGEFDSQSFLFPTPALVEDGIRSILRERLSPMLVRKGGRVLLPSSVTVNPDLEIGPRPYTGDVKYKLARLGWNRPDLAQAVFFAAAYRSPFAIIVGFRDERSVAPTLLRVGDISVAMATWNAAASVSAFEAEQQLVEDVASALRQAELAA
jgi:hypothetical protein